MAQPSLDDGSHPECTPVQQFLDEVCRKQPLAPPDPAQEFAERLRAMLEAELDTGLEALLHEVKAGFGHALGFYLCEQQMRAAEPPPPQPGPAPKPGPAPTPVFDLLTVEVGQELVKLTDPKHGGLLLARVPKLREHMKWELGLTLGGVRFRDNLGLEPNQWRVLLREAPIGGGRLLPDMLLAIGPSIKLKALRRPETPDPTFGMPSAWIDPSQRRQAELLGLMNFDPATVFAIHLTETVRRHAADLLEPQQVNRMVEDLRATQPALVAQLFPRDNERAAVELGLLELTTVLRGLLAEQVPIRDLARILEVLARSLAVSRHPEYLLAQVRIALGRSIVASHLDVHERLHAILLDPDLEERLLGRLAWTANEADLRLDPADLRDLGVALQSPLRALQELARPPLLLTHVKLRRPCMALLRRIQPHMLVLAWEELAGGVEVLGYPARMIERPRGSRRRIRISP